MSSNTYSNAFLAALFSLSDIEIKNSDVSRPKFRNTTMKYYSSANRSKFNCKNLRKTHNIGQPQWRGYSH